MRQVFELDHQLNDRLSLFARYSYSPSELSARYPGFALSTLSESRITTQTATVGATWTLTPRIINDVRVNYSRNSGIGSHTLDNFGGTVPLTNASLHLPSPFTTQNSEFLLRISLVCKAAPCSKGTARRTCRDRLI